MTQASVGFQCPECVKGAAKSSPVVNFRDLRAGGRPIVTMALVAVNVVAMIAVGIQGRSFTVGSGQLWQDGVLIGHGTRPETPPASGSRPSAWPTGRSTGSSPAASSTPGCSTSA